MPLPMEMCERMCGSPVPAQTMFGFDGATASDPMDDTPKLSKIDCHVTPASVVFQMPPLAAPA